MNRILRALGVVLAMSVAPQAAGQAFDPALLSEARGQTVWFNAWGGSPQINDYIAWVGEAVRERYGVTLEHVKVVDTAEVVARVATEKAAGRDEGGSIDLVWINGENFRAMKEQGLLFGPFTDRLPNYGLVDPAGNPTLLMDFTESVEGLESPWGMAQFNLIYDSEEVVEPPRDPPALLAWCREHPGRFTYPAPPDFVGTTFLKHLLYALTDHRARLREPVGAAEFETITAPLWAYLDELHPLLWRGGANFPANKEALHQLLDDREVAFSMAFNPTEAASLVLAGRLPESVRTYAPAVGSIGNTHFVAIPYNASSKAGAMVVANFLLSPEAQARKQDPMVWGDPTVLDPGRLDAQERAAFELAADYPQLPGELEPVLLEPDSSWMELLEEGWLRRYAS